MLDAWNTFSLRLMDFLLGWLLAMPGDVRVFVLAIGTAGILTLARRFTTRQDLLHLADKDAKRLKQLIKEAKRHRDKGAIQRYRATHSMVAMLKLGAEGKPILVSILPIAMLATWAMARMEFHPPQADEPVSVTIYTPVGAAGEVVHLVPEDSVAADGWVKSVQAVTDEGPPHGLATWTLRASAADQPRALTFRLKDQTYRHELRVGQRIYSTPLIDHGGQVLTELSMRPLKLFNVVPGVPGLYLPPWLLAYLLITIPFVFILKKMLRIY